MNLDTVILLNSIMTIQKNSSIMEPCTSNEPWVFCEYFQKWDSWSHSSLSLCQASNQSVLHGQLRIGALQQFRQLLPAFGSRVGRDVQMGVVVLWVVERWYSDTQERSLVSVVHYESRLPLIDTNSSRVLQRKQANHSGSSHHLFKWLGFQVEWPSKQGCVNHAIDPATFHQPKARVMLGRIFPTPTKMFLLPPASQHLNIIRAMCGGSR